MLRPRGEPKIYRQNDNWYVRIYVPKTVIAMVGRKEIHRALNTTDRREAVERAIDRRREQFHWFNELLDHHTSAPNVVDALTDEQIAEVARSVYLNYRAVIIDDLGEFLHLSSEEQAQHSIQPEHRGEVLRDMIASFDPIGAAKQYAASELKRLGLAIPPDSADYTKLIQRLRGAFTQIHVDFVNNYANTPGREDNPYFIESATQEPIQAITATRSRVQLSYKLADLAKQLLNEISDRRGGKGIGKIQNTLDLMCSYFDPTLDIREIGRSEVIAFRDALNQVPSNMSKRYPGKTMIEAIEARKPEHKTLSVASVNTHLQNVVQLFNVTELNDEDYRPPNLTKIKLIDPVAEIDKRLPFSQGKLRVLFESTKFRKDAVVRGPFYWACLVGLYHGFRANCQRRTKTTSFAGEKVHQLGWYRFVHSPARRSALI